MLLIMSLVNSKQQTHCLIVVYEQLDLYSISLYLLYKDWACFCLILTEVTGDVIRNVDLPISVFAPHAASAGAGVSVFLSLAVNGDVSSGQDGIILGTD